MPDQTDHFKKPQRFHRFKLEPEDAPALLAMPKDQHDALMSEGSCVAIAERLGIKVGTMKSRRHRARAAIMAARKKHRA